MSVWTNPPHTVTIKKRVATVDDYGGNVYTLTTVGTWDCWVLPVSMQEADNWFRRRIIVTHKLLGPTDPEVDEENIIEYNGQTFEIRGYLDVASLGRVYQVMAEVRPKGDA